MCKNYPKLFLFLCLYLHNKYKSDIYSLIYIPRYFSCIICNRLLCQVKESLPRHSVFIRNETNETGNVYYKQDIHKGKYFEVNVIPRTCFKM